MTNGRQMRLRKTERLLPSAGKTEQKLIEARPLGQAVLRRTATDFKRGLTLELSGHRRLDALGRAEKMDGVPQPGPRWSAVGAPLERRVRHHWGHDERGVESLAYP